MLNPTSLTDLQEAIRSHPCILAVGARTKPRLSQVENCTLLSMRGLSGITEYQPSEYTFTAWAGTPVRELEQVLLEQGQAMPFDPLLSMAGSTLGGATATGLSGPGRFRYGGIRDFLLGLTYIDGAGQLIRTGSRVVKNAAGFDLPKLMVGSLGRYGVLAELTFKVFPAFRERMTLQVHCTDPQHATERLISAAASRWELLALDYQPTLNRLLLQLGGPQHAIEQLATDIGNRWQGDVHLMDSNEASHCWETIRTLGLSPNGSQRSPHPIVAQVVLTPTVIPELELKLDLKEGVRVHYSVGGNVATLTCLQPENLPSISKLLAGLRLTGLVLQGNQSPLWLGMAAQDSNPRAIDRAIQAALDPQHRFPSLIPANLQVADAPHHRS